MKKKLTKEEFEENYARDSGITIEEYRETQVTLPCNCSYEGCKGWAAVSNNERAIKAHKDLYQ